MGFDDLPCNRQAETRAAGRGLRLIVCLIELFEDVRQLFRRDSGARITHGNRHLVVRTFDGKLNRSAAIGELESVRQKIAEDLIDPVFVP